MMGLWTFENYFEWQGSIKPFFKEITKLMNVERESETYLEFCQTSMEELFSENSQWFLAFLTVNYLRIKAPS